MKKSILFCSLFSLLCSLTFGQSYKNASEPDKMWGYYCYRELPIAGVTIDPNVYRETDTKWYDARTSILPLELV